MNPKQFAIVYWPSKGLYFAASGGIRRSISPKMVDVPSDVTGAPIDTFNAGNEVKITLTPTGFLTAAHMAALFPYSTGAVEVGSNVFSDDIIIVYEQDGTRTTYYNGAETKEPDLGVVADQTGALGSMEFTMLEAQGGDFAGQLELVEYNQQLPDYSFMDASTLFRGAPLVKWFKDCTTGATVATGTFTNDGTNFVNNEEVVIGNNRYTFKGALTVPAVPYEVLIGANAAASLLNLKAAINLTGTAGTTYGTGTLRHPDVNCTGTGPLTLTTYAKGAAGNAIGTSETCAHASFGATHLTGGQDAHAADNAVGYSADPSEPGFWNIKTERGVMINMGAKLSPLTDGGSSSLRGYSLDGFEPKVTFKPTNLTRAAFAAARNTTRGESLVKGDLVITAGTSPTALTAVLVGAVLTQPELINSKNDLVYGDMKFACTTQISGGRVQPPLRLALV